MNARRGFALIEMLTTLMFCTVFLLISARLFGATVMTLHDAPRQANQMAQLEQIRVRLSADVWAAAEIACPDKQSLRLVDPAGVVTRWRYREDGAIVREQADNAQRWPDALPVRFAAHGATVQISDKDRTWSFTSQLISGRSGS